MLVLSRREGEKIQIGDNVVMTIQRINGRCVTVSFEAPLSIRIFRGELIEPKQKTSDPCLTNENCSG